MGDLIVMSRPKPFPAREFFASHSAEILFFTGVRYYRMDDAAEPAKLVAGKLVAVKSAAGKRSAAKRRRSPEQNSASKRLSDSRLHEAFA